MSTVRLGGIDIVAQDVRPVAKKQLPSGGSSGVLLGPTPNGKMYLSTHAHRGHRGKKAQWTISVHHEYALFEAADMHGWRCFRHHYWAPGDREGRVRLGEQGERLAKFPRNKVPRSPWHGYPVSPKIDGSRGRPTDALLEEWVESRVVTRTFARRLQGNRL